MRCALCVVRKEKDKTEIKNKVKINDIFVIKINFITQLL